MLIGARHDCVAGGEDLPAKMSILKRLGFDFVELALSQEQISTLSAASAAEYTTAIAQTSLPIRSTSMGHFGGFAALAPGHRTEIVTHVRALIPWTKAIGADTILLATREEQERVADYAGVYREALLPLADEAAAMGVTLALEHVGWFKPALLAQLVRTIDHPAVRIYFDMGNCLYVGESPLAQARICAPLIAQLHIKGGPVAPLAAMPLVGVREILEGVGFQGRGCLELAAITGDRHLAEARGLLKMAGYC